MTNTRMMCQEQLKHRNQHPEVPNVSIKAKSKLHIRTLTRLNRPQPTHVGAHLLYIRVTPLPPPPPLFVHFYSQIRSSFTYKVGQLTCEQILELHKTIWNSANIHMFCKPLIMTYMCRILVSSYIVFLP